MMFVLLCDFGMFKPRIGVRQALSDSGHVPEDLPGGGHLCDIATAI